MKLVCNAAGGIGNRIKTLLTCLTITKPEDILLMWPPTTSYQNDGGVWCEFNDLWKNQFQIIDRKPDYEHRYYGRDARLKHYNNGNFVSLEEAYLKPGIRSSFHFLEMKDLVQSLIPVDYVQEKIEEYKKQIPLNSCTLSLRTYMSFPLEYHQRGKRFKIEKVFDLIENEIKSDKIFLTADHEETVNEIKNRYGDRIFLTEKRTEFGDYTCKEGLQDALIDLYLGGMTKKLYITSKCTFSEMQWWFGGCTAEPVEISVHHPSLREISSEKPPVNVQPKKNLPLPEVTFNSSGITDGNINKV
jgi:hypothetical protein